MHLSIISYFLTLWSKRLLKKNAGNIGTYLKMDAAISLLLYSYRYDVVKNTTKTPLLASSLCQRICTDNAERTFCQSEHHLVPYFLALKFFYSSIFFIFRDCQVKFINWADKHDIEAFWGSLCLNSVPVSLPKICPIAIN